MAAPTTTNEVTVRRLSDVVTGLWGKTKEYAVADVAWDSTNKKLTKTVNGTASDIVTSSTLTTALTGSIADGNTGFVTGDAAYDALALKANLASPTLTGTPKAPTAAAGTNTTQIATTAFVKTAVDNAIATADALTYKGTVEGGSTGEYGALTPAASKGDVYKVATAGKIDGVKVEIGDMLVCNADSTAAATSSTYSTIVNNWDFIQTNIDGAVTSSASSVTTNTVAIFDGTTGKIIKSSGYTIGKSVPSNAVFTDASVTAVGNHYTPATDSSAEKDASGGTATQLPTSSGSSNVQVVTGITMDAKGHVTGVVSKGLWSPNTTYSSQAAAAGGTTNSLCTTGEKYTWNNKQDLISDLTTIRAQAGGAVRYDTAQTLTSDQQTQARSNIGAGTSDLTIGTTASTAAAGNHTHTTTLASDTGTSTVTLSHGGKYKLTAGGTSVIFTMPTDNNTDTKVKATAKTDDVNYKILATASASPTSGNATEAVYDADITLNPSTNTIAANISGDAATASAAKSGSALETAINGKVSTSTTVNGHALSGNVTVTAADVSAVRYDTASQGLSDTQKSNARTNIGAGTSNLALGTSSTTAAKGDHTHTTSIATSTGTNQITLAASTKYAITAGGTSYVFTTPPNTTYSSKTAASGGTDVSLCTTGEKYTWNSKQDALTEMTTTEVDDLLAALT